MKNVVQFTCIIIKGDVFVKNPFKIRLIVITLIASAMLLINGCGTQTELQNTYSTDETSQQTTVSEQTTTDNSDFAQPDRLYPPLQRGADVSLYQDDFSNYNLTFKEDEYNKDDIETYTFFDSTVFEGAEDEAHKILEEGKNPGLGIKKLHAEGITGKGVNVAIIDQILLSDNPEIKDRVMENNDIIGNSPDDYGSMHSLSVSSILCGNNVGVAPESLLHFYNIGEGTLDASIYANALNKIIEENKTFANADKIKVVSVSAAPEKGFMEHSEDWSEAVQEAEKQGIMIIDCRMNQDTGFVFSSYYDKDDPENPEKATAGYVTDNDGRDYKDSFWENYLFAPAGYRTVAEEMTPGVRHYRFDGDGGQSWAIPYVAGVCALGFQIYPQMTKDQCKELLFSSSYVNNDGNHMIDPVAFIKAVKALEK